MRYLMTTITQNLGFKLLPGQHLLHGPEQRLPPAGPPAQLLATGLLSKCFPSTHT
uniref:Uncharacterized protein n=1 Tax=Anguilla anguilla TaxID=7936 RepID=A0A0E9R8E4_ANGAN